MNTDISIMIELQRLWDNILRLQNDIEKSRKSILYWQQQTEEKFKEISFYEESTKQMKVTVKQKEIELNGMDEQLKKLEKRKDVIVNEKEMKALDHELTKINDDKNKIENELIELFDIIDQREKTLTEQKNVLREMQQQSAADITELNDRISRFTASSDENQHKFDASSEQLSGTVKSRFLKLIKSQNGKAIAPLSGQNCGACNFEIPFNLLQDALKENSIVNCTNCGRFIYKS